MNQKQITMVTAKIGGKIVVLAAGDRVIEFGGSRHFEIQSIEIPKYVNRKARLNTGELARQCHYDIRTDSGKSLTLSYFQIMKRMRGMNDYLHTHTHRSIALLALEKFYRTKKILDMV